ncbi:MAG: hypothetical protein CBC48_17330 [bacterium TMED88]|nr:hypothetical protein [Deltaproteobacteria bacterium]OUV24715.1 MAG: hypothetical protein CBC48_17330 [bacterium TMED88]
MAGDRYKIQDESTLEDLVGKPLNFLIEKVAPKLNQPMKAFIEASSLAIVSTIDANGRVDVSPKGDSPGFVQVDEQGNLLIPERVGNRLVFGFRNILRNGETGLIFLAPHQRETLRIKGKATLHTDPDVLEAKSDFEIFRALADTYGVGSYFEKTPEEYIGTMLDVDTPQLCGVDVDRLKKEKVIFPWPTQEPYVGLRERVIPTVSGRAEIYKENLLGYGSELPFFKEPIEATPKNPLFERFPLVLLSSHSRYRIHSTFANLETIKKREPEPVVRIHAADARRRDIEDGSLVAIFNDRGRVKLRCKVDDAMREGCVLISEGHWVDQFAEGDPYGLTHDQFSPTTENYAHYDVLVEMAQS